jgi:LCP family protein required for cell wall assembly
MHHRRKRRHAGRTLLVILCLLLLIVLGAAGLISGKLARLDRDGYADVVDEDGNIVSIQQGKTASGGVLGVLKGALGIGSKDIVNILLIGSDMRIPNTDDIGRGDVTMLCSLNKKTGAVKLASFERGTGVPWEGHEWLMLTSFYRFNGPVATTKVLGDCFQIDFDAYAHVDFDSFREIIDTIGGVDVELTAGEADKIGLPYGGMNHLDGKQALAFCRLRSIDSNWERTGRQRRTIQAVLTKAKTLSLTQLNELADTVLPMIDTDLDNETITGIMMNALKFVGAKAGQLVVPDQEHILPGGMGYNKVDFDYEAERIRLFLES